MILKMIEIVVFLAIASVCLPLLIFLPFAIGA